MRILWTHSDARRNEDWWQKSGDHKADEGTKRQEGSSEFPRQINYLKRYSVKIIKLSEPLKPLLREDVEWTWDSTHQDVFDAIKEELTKTPVLVYFDPKSEHVIQTDCFWKDWVQCCYKKVDQWSTYPEHSLLLRSTTPIKRDNC